MMYMHAPHWSCVRRGSITALLLFAHPAFAAETESEVRPETSSPTTKRHEPMKHHDRADTGKWKFRAIHNMDEMHRMGGAPGMGLEGGRIHMPAGTAPDQRSDGPR